MKTLKINCLLALLALAVFSCTKDYDGPPLKEPVYEGKGNITVAQLKEQYKDVTTPTLIEFEYVLQGRIVGNDETGNIYKQLVVEDEKGTGGIVVSIDQNSMYATHRVGQEIFIELHRLYMLTYGGELQIGYDGTNANRIAWDIFKEHCFFNGYPDQSKVVPTTVTIDQLSDKNVNTLIRIDDVYFANGGKNNFTTGDATTEEALKDGNGNSLAVRTSSFSTFANELLPSGGGSVIGVLGRFNGSWQLAIRGLGDLIEFGRDIPGGTPDPDPSPGDVVFNETFGTGTYPSGSRPKIKDFTDFDMKAPVAYKDGSNEGEGNADIRSISGANGAHVWLPATRDSELVITGINTSGTENMTLSFQLAANVSDTGVAATNLNVIEVKVDGAALTIPSTPVSALNGDANKFYSFEFKGVVPAKENLTIEFRSNGTTNTAGIRLDNIKISPASTGIDL